MHVPCDIYDVLPLNLLLCSILPGLMQRKLVWESRLECDSWGLLEIDMLLTDDILEIGKRSDLNSTRDVLLSPAMYIQLPYINMEI